MWIKAIEIIEVATNQAEAQEMATGLRSQGGVWGVRVIGDGVSKAWAAQGFMDLPENVESSALPDGMKIRWMRK